VILGLEGAVVELEGVVGLAVGMVEVVGRLGIVLRASSGIVLQGSVNSKLLVRVLQAR